MVQQLLVKNRFCSYSAFSNKHYHFNMKNVHPVLLVELLVEHESPPITTRPGLQFTQQVSIEYHFLLVKNHFCHTTKHHFIDLPFDKRPFDAMPRNLDEDCQDVILNKSLFFLFEDPQRCLLLFDAVQANYN